MLFVFWNVHVYMYLLSTLWFFKCVTVECFCKFNKVVKLEQFCVVSTNMLYVCVLFLEFQQVRYLWMNVPFPFPHRNYLTFQWYSWKYSDFFFCFLFEDHGCFFFFNWSIVHEDHVFYQLLKFKFVRETSLWPNN